jgi:deazaflavin-dependent oxidoreductase (nitroreductase family)
MATRVEPIHVPSVVGLFNPIARRVLRLGALLGPNALITVRGRKTGLPRTTPVALVELEGKRWVIGTFGEVNWVRNLRASGEATLSLGRRQEQVRASELTMEERTVFFRDLIGPYVRRLPVGTLLLSILGAKDILEDPAGAAERRPVFELDAAA